MTWQFFPKLAFAYEMLGESSIFYFGGVVAACGHLMLLSK
jgi:hypothetical protein